METSTSTSSSATSSSVTSSSATSLSVTRSTVEPTVTTLSELEIARAEVTGVVEAWFHFPFDTSKGEEGIGAEYLTGLILQRSLEVVQRLELEGQIQRSQQTQRLDITAVSVDLEAGMAEVDSCAGFGQELIDAASEEVLVSEDPTYTTTGTFELQLTDAGWKISEWRLSRNTDTPVECEVGE
jgi:hypothetical protein